jgi:hypothetical protein
MFIVLVIAFIFRRRLALRWGELAIWWAHRK